MGRSNVHKALGRSQLNKTNTDALETKWPDPNVPGRTTSHSAIQCGRPNDATREKMENGPLKCAQGTRAVTT